MHFGNRRVWMGKDETKMAILLHRKSVDHMCFHHMITPYRQRSQKHTNAHILCWLCAIKFRVKCRSNQRTHTHRMHIFNTQLSTMQCFQEIWRHLNKLKTEAAKKNALKKHTRPANVIERPRTRMTERRRYKQKATVNNSTRKKGILNAMLCEWINGTSSEQMRLSVLFIHICWPCASERCTVGISVPPMCHLRRVSHFNSVLCT